MKTYLLGKTKSIDRARSKLVKKLGLWWYQKLTDEEWEVQKHSVVCFAPDNIHDSATLNQFTIDQQCNYDMVDAPQYKIYLIPNYKDGKGAMVFKMHHNMADG
jgi:NRPS condensation-like uncharacterized protein